MAMMQPGMFLSQPPTATKASKPWQPTTVSMESAMTSRDTREYFMPSVPIEMPSEMVMVLNTTALPPFSLMPWATLTANWSMCMLHGVTMLQVEATPIWGFWKSSFLKPVAYSIPRLGARSIPSTTMEEKGRGSESVLDLAGALAVDRRFIAARSSRSGRVCGRQKIAARPWHQLRRCDSGGGTVIF